MSDPGGTDLLRLGKFRTEMIVSHGTVIAPNGGSAPSSGRVRCTIWPLRTWSPGEGLALAFGGLLAWLRRRRADRLTRACRHSMRC